MTGTERTESTWEESVVFYDGIYYCVALDKF